MSFFLAALDAGCGRVAHPAPAFGEGRHHQGGIPSPLHGRGRRLATGRAPLGRERVPPGNVRLALATRRVPLGGERASPGRPCASLATGRASSGRECVLFGTERQAPGRERPPFTSQRRRPRRESRPFVAPRASLETGRLDRKRSLGLACARGAAGSDQERRAGGPRPTCAFDLRSTPTATPTRPNPTSPPAPPTTPTTKTVPAYGRH